MPISRCSILPPGFREGCPVKVKQVRQSSPRVVDSTFLWASAIGFVIDGFKQPLMIGPAYPFQDARNRNPSSPVISKNALEYNLICEQNDLYITARIIKKIYDEGSSSGRSQGRSEECAALPPALANPQVASSPCKSS